MTALEHLEAALRQLDLEGDTLSGAHVSLAIEVLKREMSGKPAEAKNPSDEDIRTL